MSVSRDMTASEAAAYNNVPAAAPGTGVSNIWVWPPEHHVWPVTYINYPHACYCGYACRRDMSVTELAEALVEKLKESDETASALAKLADAIQKRGSK